MYLEPATVRVAALPRSLLHLQFLLDNGERPDLLLFRDEAMRVPLERHFPGRTMFLGREQRGSLSPFGLRAVRRANAAYYRHVATLLAPCRLDRLILFLEGEPLERFLGKLPCVGTIELWEDGLSHYVDLTSNAWYAARGLVQAVVGFHPAGITRRRIDRTAIRVRDRFEQHNLVLTPPPPAPHHRDALLFIGSPLVEDGILSRTRFVAGMRAIVAASPLILRYLPHPREDLVRVRTDLAAFAGITIEPNPNGLVEHAATYDYTAYVAAVSTGLLDLGRYDRSLFVPSIFGLARMSRVLRGWAANPVAVALSSDDLPSMIKCAITRSAPTG